MNTFEDNLNGSSDAEVQLQQKLRELAESDPSEFKCKEDCDRLAAQFRTNKLIVKKMYKDIRASIKRERKPSVPPGTVEQNNPNGIPMDRAPGGFKLISFGVRRFLPAEAKEDEEIITRTPIWVEARCRDLSGRRDGRLVVWIDDEGKRWQKVILKSRFHERGNDLIQELVDERVDIEVGKETQLLKYLAAFRTDQYFRVISGTGWITKKIFALPDGTILGNDDADENVRLLNPIHIGVERQGSLDGWKHGIAALCVGNSRLIFAVSLAFAAPMLDIVGLENGGVNFRDGSGIGKSTCAIVAASPYGSKDFTVSMRATANGLEGRAVEHNDLVLILDEINQASQKEVGSIIYMLGNGDGKLRGTKSGGARAVSRFATLFIVTGEVPLAQYILSAGLRPMAGQEARLLDFPADTGVHGAFENLHGYSNGAAFSDALKRACTENFGLAGPEFIEKLTLHRESVSAKFEEFARDFAQNHVENNASGQVRRAARRIALIAFAGEKATAWDITGWQPGDATAAAAKMLQAWIAARGGQGSHEKSALLSHVRLFFEQNISRFENWRNSRRDGDGNEIEDVPVRDRAGFRDGENFYVLPQVFQKDLIGNFSRDWAVTTLKEEQLLLPTPANLEKGKKERPDSTIRPPKLGKPIKAYHFVDVLEGE